jgi:hypothetical protein
MAQPEVAVYKLQGGQHCLVMKDSAISTVWQNQTTPENTRITLLVLGTDTPSIKWFKWKCLGGSTQSVHALKAAE